MTALTQITDDLPAAIASDILGYARSVQAALPDIFRDARMRADTSIGDQLVFLAGMKKLESLVSSQFWTLENSLHAMAESGVEGVRVGPRTLSRGSDYHERLREMLLDLEQILAEAGLTELLAERSYSQIARQLRIGR